LFLPVFPGMQLPTSVTTAVRALEVPGAPSPLQFVLDFFDRHGDEDVLLLSLGAALLAPDLCELLLKTHKASNADATTVRELPEGATVEVLSRRFANVVRHASPVGSPASVRATIEVLGGLADGDGRPIVSAVQLSMPAIFPASGLRTERIAFERAEEQSALELVLGKIDETSEPLIRPWRRARNALREEAWATLRRTATHENRGDAEPHVLFATSSAGYTGGERMLQSLICQIAARGIKVTLLMRYESELSHQCQRAGCRVRYVGESLLDATVFSIVTIAHLVAEEKPDIIHINGMVGPGLPTAAIQRRIPIVQHVRTLDNVSLNEQIDASTIAVAISRGVRDELIAAGVPTGKIRLVYNGYEPCEWTRRDHSRDGARAELGLDSDDIVVVYVARYADNKRHPLLFDAIGLLKRSMPQIKLLLVGDPATDPGGYRSARACAERAGIAGIVRELHHASDMKAVYTAADVTVMCSVREPFGNCVCEAMLMESPVVVCGSGGFMEIVEHNVSGFVVDDQHASPLAAAVAALLADKGAYQRLAVAGRSLVADTLTLEQHVQGILSAYKDANAALQM